ncbi:MAG TPA: DHH family phosphoesterase, partial [Solirubrobacteraceae bacterium]|nr:DHH family phosphoesterase [Solirubrobacteraceae bacterium]
MSVADGAVASRDQVLASIAEDQRFVLATHEHPDGDALGSLVAMQELLSGLGKDSLMFVSPGDLPLPSEYSMFLLESAIHEPPADIATRTVVFLDCGNIDRNSAAVLRDGARLLNIDHHHDNTRFGTINHVVADASCTAEVVWDLMHGLGVAPRGAVADALYIGLVTDTGRFMYENTGQTAHLMAADLIDAGVQVHEIYRRVYEGMPYGKLALLARGLSNVERYDDGRLTMSALSVSDFNDSQAE